MGFSVSATFAIFFIAFLAIGSSVYQTTYGTFKAVSISVSDQQDMMISARQTEISISSIDVTGNSGDYDLTITLSNSGSTTLDPSMLSILIDGALQVNNLSTTAWFPEESITVTFEHLSSLITDHRVKIVTENGISAYDTYTT